MDRVRVGLPVSGMRALPFVVALLWVLCGHLSSCSGDDKKKYVANVDPEVTPTMTTTDVSTLISDSGIVRYRVQAPVWYVYDEAKEPKWTFPQSLHLESFDDMFNKDATIDCDSATYLTNVQIWRLDGNVRVVNMAGERFLTEQLFWDQRKQSVYSDSFIQIIRADRIMEGYGFVSNESMTDFAVRNVSAILPVEMMNGEAKQPASAAPADSTTASASVREPSAAAPDSTLSTVRRPKRLRPQPKQLQ
ncbi:MAG: LPS export ABC transporter periplasmic protein LptC [Paramuribaculum sp.]|nr:LPS export ABC transporter periplasmic protein LptC [Paramuribaculum sp.]